MILVYVCVRRLSMKRTRGTVSFERLGHVMQQQTALGSRRVREERPSARGLTTEGPGRDNG